MFTFLKSHSILILLITLAVTCRLYKIDSPLIEYHSWRQADTAAVARNFVRDGFDLLHPRYDDLSDAQTGIDNPQGYRMVEFPLYNATFGLFAKLFPTLPTIIWGTVTLSLDIWGRLISTVAACVILTCIYRIAKHEADELAAIVTSIVFATFPFFVFYTRAILPETFAMMWVMVAVLTIYRQISPWRITIALICFAISMLVKPTTIFFAIAIVFLLWKHLRVPVVSRALYIVLLMALSSIPIILWRIYISTYPEGIPASGWLLTSVNTGGAQQFIFFRPAFFRWIFYERINLLILGSFPLVFLVVGLLKRTRTSMPLALLASSMAYVLTFQGGNVQHEYYQILILPVLALYVGLGASHLYHTIHSPVKKALLVGVCMAVLALGWIFSWDKVHHYYYSLSDIPSFTTIVQTFVREDEKIVVDTGGDTTALYAFDRKGAPVVFADPPTLKEKGYHYLFTYNLETSQNLQKDFGVKLIFGSDRFALLQL